MKGINYIPVLMAFISCNIQNKDIKVSSSIKETKAPLIEKNILDIDFNLVNGILLYKEKPYSGIVNETYSNGSKKTKSEYLKGNRNGSFRGWYANGNRQFNRVYKSGLKVGIHLGWYKNDQQMFELQFNENGEYNGSVKEWYVNGILASYFNYVNGKEEGGQQMWDLKGEIKSNFVTKKGERFGLIGLKKCYSINTKNEVLK